MTDDFLKVKLQRVARRYQWLALWRKLAVCWAVAALVGVTLVWIQDALGFVSPVTLPLLAALTAGAVAAVSLLHFVREPDPRWVARQIEKRHPELDGVLITAVQQQTEPGREQGYLQYRVLQEATARSQEQDWRQVVPTARLATGLAVHGVALVCFVVALSRLHVSPIHGEAPRWASADGVTVTPGDASVERGDSLVVLARFGSALPPHVNLVMQESGAPARTIPLVKSLADPVFGGSITEVAADFTYRLEYRGQHTREFKVTVYEHPKLVRSDVDLTFPGYTKLAPKRIEDTRRVSAVEGTRMDFALQLNKPVKSAKLVARDGKKTEIALQVAPDKAVATLTGFVPEKSQNYELQLVDAEGRANKIAAPFAIDVQRNRPPELRIVSPRGDVRPSALEEVAFEGTVWDDFGTPAYGLAYSVAGGETKFIELGREGAAKEKHPLNHLLKLEELGAKPDDLIAWHLWADDVGPDGKVRRTHGDLYFAEVRAFDEIFRESQNMESGESGGGGGNEARQLAELQKQIIGATWRLQREGATPRYAEDVKVVTGSQEQALAQAGESAAEARSPRQQALWQTVTQEMEKAIEKLKDAGKSPAPLAQALPAEQAAYQAILKLSARETAVTRRQSGGGGGGGGQNQRQIDELDLQQSENRYETQRQARAPQNRERQEQLAILNRLQELARRQQDLNDRLKELQTALQEARTEREREEIARRLKRLEEEQRQMLADADELRQRMDRAENQSSMSQQRQQLEQTRDELQRAADAAAEGSAAQALASGTRAQRQLQEMRDELRKQNSSQFAEELRDMRGEARELARQQEELTKKLDAMANGGNQPRKSLSDSGERKEVLDRLEQQKERMNRLVDRATQVSEQAENTEPLLSRQLYDSIRKVSQDDANSVKQARSDLVNSGMMTRDLAERLQRAQEREEGGRALDATRDMLREGYLPQARQVGQRASGQIDELRRGVERAAESVLGDDAEQLKLARSELDSLAEQLQREIAQAGGNPGEPQPGQSGQPQQAGQPGGQPPQGDRRMAGNQPGQNDPQQAQQPGGQQPGEQQEGGQPGEGRQPGQGRQPGEPGERSQQMAGADGQQGQAGGGDRPGEQPSSASGGRSGADRQQANQAGGGGRGSERQTAEARGGRNPGTRNQRGGGGDRLGLDNLNLSDAFNPGNERGGGLGGWEGGPWRAGPLTGEDFNRWVERLRDVEDLVETPEMRNALAAARERARMLRRDYNLDRKKPDWTVVKLEVLKPLVEVRSRVAEELARRESKDSLVPIDRDPVPNRFAESVRRYYEELGKDR